MIQKWNFDNLDRSIGIQLDISTFYLYYIDLLSVVDFLPNNFFYYQSSLKYTI